MILFLYILLGVVAGAFSGLIGVGGGIILVPALVLLFKFSQQMAQGTTLALLLPPIGIFAAFTYYKQGYVDIKVAILLAAGFVFGSIFGSRVAVGIPEVTLQRIFGLVTLLIGLKFFFFPS